MTIRFYWIHPLLFVLLFLRTIFTGPQAVAQEEENESQTEVPNAVSDDQAEESETEDDETEEKEPKLDPGMLGGLRFRNIGPALMSGRVIDLAVDPEKASTWYLAAASGGVWKTTNAGTTWTPIFDGYGSYSIGCITIDPNNRHCLWVGTGENNSQRSVGYGDGLYKSLDGGKSFKKVGLAESEHIGMIRVDPRDSDVVYVAAQGPLWSSGGDRGLYKTTDGGASWERIQHISEDTGISEVHLDPRDPDTIYTVAYQRRRHVWTLIDGGPESGVHKSTDGGKTWTQLKSGLPGGDVGRIGLAVSPMNPDILYAIVEAARGGSGVYRSADRGHTWSKMSSYVSSSPQYYQELVADPNVFDRIYSMDTYLQVSHDGGATWESVGERWKHVDNHAMIIDSDDSDHFLVGCDGGLYETWDRGENYKFFPNLPLTQFYKIAVDNAEPFYNVYGGTQDNATQGGPSQTFSGHGIRNSDWFITVFGDGFDPAIDPTDPNIVYSQWQYGGLVRFDRRSGQRVDIKPQEDPDGPPLRWNWDSALIISPHNSNRLYYGAQILFQSDDQGMSWKTISPDLTRNLDRNKLKVMGRIWGVDTVAKNASTSFYGTIVALAESPLVEGLIYAGTDDGLVQITEDGGENWRKVEAFEFLNVPERAYVSDIEPSQLDPDTVYVVVENHKMGDFKPYVLKSSDRGKSWTSISSNLPDRGSAYTIAVDHVDPDLLFVGTEFGVFATVDGGREWVQLKGGLPTICIRDLEIQRREEDLVVGTFGRGIAILDDYSPLRQLADGIESDSPVILPIKPAELYVERNEMAGGEKAYQGSTFFNAPNPAVGATITYCLPESLKTKQAERIEREAKASKNGGDVPYPSWEDLKDEDREESPRIILTIRDSNGEVVDRFDGPSGQGLHRVTWDFQLPGYRPIGATGGSSGPGPRALPGTYTVDLGQWHEDQWTELVGPTAFEGQPIGFQALSEEAKVEALVFQRQTGELVRVAFGTYRAASDAMVQLEAMKQAIDLTPSLGPAELAEARALELKLQDLLEAFQGDPTKSRRNEPAMPGLLDRINQIVFGHWSTEMGPTQTHRKNFEIAAAQLESLMDELRVFLESELPGLGERLEAAGAPWTPGRALPTWKRPTPPGQETAE